MYYVHIHTNDNRIVAVPAKYLKTSGMGMVWDVKANKWLSPMSADFELNTFAHSFEVL